MDDTLVDRLARIETKLDRVLDDHQGVSTRVSALEASIGKLMGIAAIVSGLIVSGIHWLFGRT